MSWKLTALVLATLLGVGLWAAGSIPGAEGTQVLGHDGEPVICPDGELLRADRGAEIQEPSPREFQKMSRRLPEGKTLAFNDYTGELRVVDAVREQLGGISIPADPFVHRCGPDDEPTLVRLSKVDPATAAELRRQVRDQLQAAKESGLLGGLGADPATKEPSGPG